MKTSIIISGQIGGNFTLRSAIPGAIEERRTMFNGFELLFENKKTAKDAINKAYKSLCADEPGMKGRLGGIRKGAESLHYDASKAVITPTNNQ